MELAPPDELYVGVIIGTEQKIFHHESQTQHILMLDDGTDVFAQAMGMFLVGEVMDMTMSIIIEMRLKLSQMDILVMSQA